ncbi:MAG TPA: response regulator transcription factor [Chloroflexota bacterium]|nr:response regulator transcription factor [Chloroflexota bacterium]
MSDAQGSPIRVLLVDDQQLVRAGLRMILCREEGFDVVGECADGAEVPAAVEALRPDVVVMDVRMPRVDGATATRRLRAVPGGPPVLVLTTFKDDEVLSAALRAGAGGFLLKDAPGEEILRAAREVAGGGAYLDPAVTARVLAAYRASPVPAGPPAPSPGPGGAVDELTARETDVLRAIGRGLSNEEIATALSIGEGTVKTHVGRIFDKLGLRDRAAAIVYAYDHGLARPAG